MSGLGPQGKVTMAKIAETARRFGLRVTSGMRDSTPEHVDRQSHRIHEERHMPERGSACPGCGSHERRYDAVDRKTYCKGCGREYEPYQQGDGEAELVQQAQLAEALMARWELHAERAGGRGGAVALTTLVDRFILAPEIDQVMIGGKSVGKRASIEAQRALVALLEPERTRYQSAKKLLEVLHRQGKVRRVEHGVWALSEVDA